MHTFQAKPESHCNMYSSVEKPGNVQIGNVQNNLPQSQALLPNSGSKAPQNRSVQLWKTNASNRSVKMRPLDDDIFFIFRK